MVNNLEAYIKSELGKSILPYDSDSPLDDKEAEEIFEDFSYFTNFDSFDALILHGSPSGKENGTRYSLFEKAAFYLQASGKNPEMFIPTEFDEDVKSSEIIHEDSVNYIEPEITEDEFTQTYKEFQGEGRIHVTSDYHAEGVDHLSELFDEDESIVLSADTANKDYPKENYTEILGPASQIANKLPISWRTWAEGKEAGRKLTDWKRGPRF